eukprot:TRINITY_DN107580_c0_g1_i1.p1 TRINITY_DN107580_c0_g1~~TRINITY_DN107580_c0_g1_i1.p1  ORF type:complete len:1225 (+),score=206.47 TRINITY_DN107580_c0_g1_i1:29-3703(+)
MEPDSSTVARLQLVSGKAREPMAEQAEMWSSLPPWGLREDPHKKRRSSRSKPSAPQGLEMTARGSDPCLHQDTDGQGGACASSLPRQPTLQRHNTWAGMLSSYLSGSQTTGSPRNEANGEVDAAGINKVPLMTQAAEWGGAAGLSSSSDSDWEGARRGAAWRQRMHPSTSSRGPQDARGPLEANGKVHVVEVEREWRGGVGFDSSDENADAEDPRAALARRREERRRQSARRAQEPATFSFQAGNAAVDNASRTEPSSASQTSLGPGRQGGDHAHPRWSRCWATPKRLTGCERYGGSLLHLVDFFLRLWTIFFYYHHKMMVVLGFLASIQAFGLVLSTYITFHDADVLLWMHKRSGARRLLFCVLIFIFFGCCQLIQVKRAWSRQLHAAEVLTDARENSIDRRSPPRRQKDDTYDDRVTTASSLQDLGAAERIMPAALITGIPFLLVLWSTICWEYSESGSSDIPHLILWTTGMLIVTVNLGIVDVDSFVSSYVMKRYQGTGHMCRDQLFRVAHFLFRSCEVIFRLLVLAGMMSASFSGNGKVTRGGALMVTPLLLDYLAGVYLLSCNSLRQEGLMVHFFAGVGLLVADLGYFVDQPNFARPARHISKRLAWLRFVELIGLSVWIVFAMSSGARRAVGFPLWGTALVYYVFRFTPIIRRLGSDLQTAAADGDVVRVRKLLVPDHNGQVLDVDAATKDSYGMTPLMLAAAGGHLEVISELLYCGAKPNLRTAVNGDTALHFAAQNGMAQACELLISKGAEIQANNVGATPAQMLHRTGTPSTDNLMEVLDGRRSVHDENSELPRSSHSVRQGKKTTYYSVKTKPVAGLQLRTLFPNLEKDETPSPRVLQSVSALVVSKAAGSLARRALAREDDSCSSVPLGALRRVRELGRGGFGRVIEVQLPRDAASTFWRRPATTNRFALKLQLVQDHRTAQSEVLALRRADHPFIVHLYRAFSFDKYFALLLELCPKDLNRLLCESTDESGRCLGLQPDRAARYMGQVMLALIHLHENETVFRDVKPENILISTMDEAKLADFGLAKVVTSAERMTMCGTPGFYAPELLSVAAISSNHDREDDGFSRMVTPRGESRESMEMNPFKTDAYSFGVTLQVALLGEDGARKKKIKRKGDMLLPLHISESENAELLAQLRSQDRLSEEAEQLLVQHLLPFSQSRRKMLASDEVKNHAFFCKELECADVEEHLLPQGTASSALSPGDSNPSGWLLSMA